MTRTETTMYTCNRCKLTLPAPKKEQSDKAPNGWTTMKIRNDFVDPLSQQIVDLCGLCSMQLLNFMDHVEGGL